MAARFVLASAFVIALLAACGGGSPATSTAPKTAAPGQTQAGATTAPATQAAVVTSAPVVSAPAVGGNGSVIHAVVGSGPQAGTYDATGPKVDCNVSPTGSGATYNNMAATQGIGSFVFTAGESGPSPTSFYFQLLFAPMGINPPEIAIDTLDPTEPNGSATAALEDNGATIKWTIDGKTKAGVPVTATIECGPVDRPNF